MQIDQNILNIGILVFFLILFLFLSKRKNYRHKRKIKNGERVLEKISSFKYPGAKINYLKKVDPFVFEELLLSAFKEKGFKIRRNKRYTGDGGIDGMMWDDQKRKYLIQAKRYSSYVSKKHLEEFEALVTSKKCYSGFFIHTGKTGKNTYKDFSNSNIHIVSGDRLLNLINTKYSEEYE